jgi:UDP-N-acetylmuramoyl-tripeptide--D-alanyl-D-alanine ligase
VTVGALGDRIAEGVRAAGTAVPVEPCSTPAEAGRWLAGQARAGDAVLFKASRGVRLEEAVREFLRMAGGPAA